MTAWAKITGKCILKTGAEDQVYQTYADTSDLFTAIGYTPAVTVKQGVAEFVKWYKAFYQK